MISCTYCNNTSSSFVKCTCSKKKKERKKERANCDFKGLNRQEMLFVTITLDTLKTCLTAVMPVLFTCFYLSTQKVQSSSAECFQWKSCLHFCLRTASASYFVWFGKWKKRFISSEWTPSGQSFPPSVLWVHYLSIRAMVLVARSLFKWRMEDLKSWWTRWSWDFTLVHLWPPHQPLITHWVFLPSIQQCIH